GELRPGQAEGAETLVAQQVGVEQGEVLLLPLDAAVAEDPLDLGARAALALAQRVGERGLQLAAHRVAVVAGAQLAPLDVGQRPGDVFRDRRAGLGDALLLRALHRGDRAVHRRVPLLAHRAG